MRKLFMALALGATMLLGTTTAHAGALTSANLQFILGTLPPASFTATGLSGAGSANGSGGTATWSVAAGAVPGGTFTTTIPTTAAPPITQIQFIINGNPSAGNFSAGSPGGMSVTGTSNIKSYGGITLLGVPLKVGTPTTVTPPVAYGVAITSIANSWTTGATTLALATPTASGATTAKVTGANGLVNGGGTVVLVTAINVLTNIAGQLPSFAILTLNYAGGGPVPEPGTLLLLGSGVLGLVAIGRKKGRR